MELHRTGKRPDWFKRPKRDYSWFQKVAQQTHGFVTPGNAITLGGLGATLYGLWLLVATQFGPAVIALTLGRLCDIADGWVAHRTDTKGPVGELLDAGSDKIVTVLGLVALGLADLAPWGLLVAVALLQAITSCVGVLALRHQHRLHPSPMGKLSMAFAWVGFGGLIVAAWASNSVVRIIGVGCIAISVVLSSYALMQYISQYRGSRDD